MRIIRIGLDASKHVFQVHGVDGNDEPALRRQLRRGAVASLLAKLAPTRIGIEIHQADCSPRSPRHDPLATIPGSDRSDRRGQLRAQSTRCEGIPLRPPPRPAPGQAFAAWLGITPRERSTAGRQRLGKISRHGDECLRRLLVLGAPAVIRQANPRVAPAGHRPTRRASPWLLQLLARKPRKLAAIALANKACPGAGRGWPASCGPGWRAARSTVVRCRHKPFRRSSRSGACKDSSKMAIGQSEDRDTPLNPMGLRPRWDVWDPVRETHLGQRSIRPHTKAGHMTPTDQTHARCAALASRGPSTDGLSGSPNPSQPDA